MGSRLFTSNLTVIASAFFGTNPASKIKSERYQRFARYTAKCEVTRPGRVLIATRFVKSTLAKT